MFGYEMNSFDALDFDVLVAAPDFL